MVCAYVFSQFAHPVYTMRMALGEGGLRRRRYARRRGQTPFTQDIAHEWDWTTTVIKFWDLQPAARCVRLAYPATFVPAQTKKARTRVPVAHLLTSPSESLGPSSDVRSTQPRCTRLLCYLLHPTPRSNASAEEVCHPVRILSSTALTQLASLLRR